jgi:pimeloyl-ACP methyl ester carboxylesterase
MTNDIESGVVMVSLRDWTRGGIHSSLGGHRIFHREEGPVDGPPVTLIHGFPTSSHDWSAVVPALVQAGHRVMTLDLLGFGASEKPKLHTYSIHEQADLVEALWSSLGIGQTALVAHDYGVSVAQELLARDPGRVTRAAWLNGGLYPALNRPLAIQRLLHSPLGKVLGPLSTERTFRMSMGKILGRPVGEETLHDMWLALSAGGGRWVQHRLLEYIADRKVHAARWEAALESYPGPTLFIWGPADPVSGAPLLERLRARIPDAQFVVLDEPPITGHYPQLENPEAVSDALMKFLA